MNSSETRWTVQDLVERAEGCAEKMDYELAAKFYQRALDLEPQNTNVMDDLGEVFMELGSTQQAIDVSSL